MKVLGVIPARGGSKGIHRKNLYPLCGKPLIQYTLDAAENSNLDDVVVTTDDPEIARYLYNSIIRPPELATDEAPMLPVIQHAVEVYNQPLDAVMILQPTSPLRRAEDINEAIEMMENGYDSVVSVTSGVHPIKSYMQGTDGTVHPFIKQTEPYDKHKHRCLTRNGAIFLMTKEVLDSGRLIGDRPFFLEMARSRSIDIDSLDDLLMAEALLERKRPACLKS